jgi:hypothetical protein
MPSPASDPREERGSCFLYFPSLLSAAATRHLSHFFTLSFFVSGPSGSCSLCSVPCTSSSASPSAGWSVAHHTSLASHLDCCGGRVHDHPSFLSPRNYLTR